MTWAQAYRLLLNLITFSIAATTSPIFRIWIKAEDFRALVMRIPVKGTISLVTVMTMQMNMWLQILREMIFLILIVSPLDLSRTYLEIRQTLFPSRSSSSLSPAILMDLR